MGVGWERGFVICFVFDFKIEIIPKNIARLLQSGNMEFIRTGYIFLDISTLSTL
ncbi:MAG: hypothetical protein ACI94Y_002764 [Maribacter sp.]|jgi:hypothetical protein